MTENNLPLISEEDLKKHIPLFSDHISNAALYYLRDLWPLGANCRSVDLISFLLSVYISSLHNLLASVAEHSGGTDKMVELVDLIIKSIVGAVDMNAKFMEQGIFNA